MKLICHRDELIRGLAIVDGAVARTSTLPVLANVLLATDGERLRLAATNLELGISCTVNAKVEAEGTTTVPAKLLAQFVKSLPSEPINIELEERTQTLSLQCTGQKARIKGISSSEYPVPSALEGAQGITIDAQLLREMIGQVAYAADTDTSRPTLTGIYTVISPEGLTMAACDGYRLARRTATIKPAPEIQASAIIPASAMREVAKIIGAADCACKLTFEKAEQGETVTRASFSLPGTEITCQVLDGQFPDYQQVVPKSYNIELRVSSAALQRTARTAMLFTDKACRIFVKLEADGRAIITARSAEYGENESEVQGTLEGEPLEFALNGQMLNDALASIPGGEVRIELNAAVNPVGIRPTDGTDLYALVTPMHKGDR